jgi:serine O-acetyltransferase
VTTGAASDPQFSAYGITQDDDPLSLAMRGLIDHAASQEDQIALLWQAIEKLSTAQSVPDCLPQGEQAERMDTKKLNELVGK